MRVLAALHPWDLTPTAAVALQRELAGGVVREGVIDPAGIRLIAGVDVSSSKDDPMLTAGVVVLDAQTLQVVDQSYARVEPPMPYVSGLLSFREIPAILGALEGLQREPDVWMVDGQGIAHPRRLGIAAHLGLWLDRPTLGVAKSLLCGTAEEPSAERGAVSPLLQHGEQIGDLLRTRANVSPVIVSLGHKMDQASAVAIALYFARGYRLPESTRLAHLGVNEARVAAQS